MRTKTGILCRLSGKLAAKVNKWKAATKQRLKDIKSGIWKKRSPLWDDVRAEFLSKQKKCVACGAKENLDVHHVKSFHEYPAEELKIRNLRALCSGPRRCHLEVGHCLLGGKPNWKVNNPNVDADIAKRRSERNSA